MGHKHLDQVSTDCYWVHLKSYSHSSSAISSRGEVMSAQSAWNQALQRSHTCNQSVPSTESTSRHKLVSSASASSFTLRGWRIFLLFAVYHILCHDHLLFHDPPSSEPGIFFSHQPFKALFFHYCFSITKTLNWACSRSELCKSRSLQKRNPSLLITNWYKPLVCIYRNIISTCQLPQSFVVYTKLFCCCTV